MFSNFVVGVVEVVVYPIIFAFFFWVVLGRVWFFDRDTSWARVRAFGGTRDGWGESGRQMLGGRGVDAWPLRRSLPRRVIVPIRSSSTTGVVDSIVGVIVRGRAPGRRGISSSSRGIGRRGGLSFLPIVVCIGSGNFDWVVRVVRQISEDRG